MQSFFMSAAVPLAAGFLYLLVAGYLELKTYRVPNKLTYAAIGLALAFALVAGVIAPERSGSIGSALLGMLLGGAILIPFYAKGILGAGCVKAQAACGAWIGAGLAITTCLKFVLIATIVAAIVGAVCFAVTYAKRKREALRPYPSADLETREQGFSLLMHAQLPLSVGTMLGVIVATLV